MEDRNRPGWWMADVSREMEGMLERRNIPIYMDYDGEERRMVEEASRSSDEFPRVSWMLSAESEAAPVDVVSYTLHLSPDTYIRVGCSVFLSRWSLQLSGEGHDEVMSYYRRIIERYGPDLTIRQGLTLFERTLEIYEGLLAQQPLTSMKEAGDGSSFSSLGS